MAHREPTKAELEAAHWVDVLDAPRVDRSLIEAFQTWLAADAAHKRAYEAVSATSDKIDALLAQESVIAPRPARTRPSRKRAIAAAALAAAAVLAFVLSPIGPIGRPRGETYAAATGQARVLELGDGSRIELAPGSHVVVDLQENERRVRFEDGVALFDVAPDPDRPFIVATRFGDIRVVGTSFVVRIVGDEARTTVMSGRVEARARRLIAQDAPVTAGRDEEIVLRGGDASVAAMEPQLIEQRLAWRERMVALEGQTLRQAADEVTRFSGVRFAFADAATANLRLGGYVAGDDVEAFLDLLDRNVGVSAERRGDGVIVLRRAGAPG